ncbi:hypothetical protein AB0383_48615 [Amycolatopsis sp. NPDC051373]|uniref:hypothetical protein n=1 Tax=Amycolatopsis sp. NPDC051373 TaxID=3155801 RepID=UPI003450AF78
MPSIENSKDCWLELAATVAECRRRRGFEVNEDEILQAVERARTAPPGDERATRFAEIAALAEQASGVAPLATRDAA